MESQAETIPAGEIDEASSENVTHRDETSDRESSIESFHTNKSEFSVPTESELIDIDDIELSDEESWLYKSPKGLKSDAKSLDVYKWLHKDIEDTENVDLQIAKTALVSKLNELKMLNCDAKYPDVTSKELSQQSCDCDMNDKSAIVTSDHEVPSACISITGAEAKKDECVVAEQNSYSQNGLDHNQENDLMANIIDVHKIARQQEESLKKSTPKFIPPAVAGKKKIESEYLFSAGRVNSLRICKPISAEALNTCIDIQNMSGSASSCDIQKHAFGSTRSLNFGHDIHRGSLPNINKDYFTLRPKKTKHQGDRTHCPLPIYPAQQKSSVNGAISEASSFESRQKMPKASCDYREARTLPSSYRVHSRSSSLNRRDSKTPTASPLRRESTPFLSNQRSAFIPDLNRRDSAPACGLRKFSMPVASSQYQRSNALSQASSKVSSQFPSDSKIQTNNEYHRRTAHSPSKRSPLSTVHNQATKRSKSPALHCNDEIKGMNFPSRIPNPVSRSGIPVPSSQYLPRYHNEDESWSQDCF